MFETPDDGSPWKRFSYDERRELGRHRILHARRMYNQVNVCPKRIKVIPKVATCLLPHFAIGSFLQLIPEESGDKHLYILPMKT